MHLLNHSSIKTSKGPSMDPCGTPDSINPHSDSVPIRRSRYSDNFLEG